MRRLSGIKPTGKIHLGNYFGAIKQYIENQDKGENFYFVADYHALTVLPDPKELARDSLDIVMDYLALGLDPEKAYIFIQSSIPEHTELCWILSNSTPVSLLQRSHAYKAAKSEGINAGLFSYPILMAADILMYNPDFVPVGKDQKQHVEIARDIAIKFNTRYGNTFKLPEVEIVKTLESMRGIDGRKMSKSYKNTIELFGSEAEMKRQIMSIVTDSKGVNEPKDPDKCNIFALYKLFIDKAEERTLRARYATSVGYGELKKELFERIIGFLRPFREKREQLSKEVDSVREILKRHTSRVRAIAQENMSKIRKRIGLIGSEFN